MNIRIFESVRWNAYVHRQDLGLYSHPKEFWGNGVRTHVNSKGKSPLPEKFSPQEDRAHDAAQSRTASSTHYQPAIPAPGCSFQGVPGRCRSKGSWGNRVNILKGPKTITLFEWLWLLRFHCYLYSVYFYSHYKASMTRTFNLPDRHKKADDHQTDRIQDACHGKL